MGISWLSIVTKIHTVGCHLAALSGIGARDSYTRPHTRTARSIEKRLPAPLTTGAIRVGHPVK
ncbi:MAG: hypothetical protein M8353_08890 [ANME-2 cluster archaeon]|nr:hypothetical protein [ANME-2 cluster archaeon]